MPVELCVSTTTESAEYSRGVFSEGLMEAVTVADKTLEVISERILEQREMGVYSTEQVEALVNLGLDDQILEIVAKDIENRGTKTVFQEVASCPKLLTSLVQRGRSVEVTEILLQSNINELMQDTFVRHPYVNVLLEVIEGAVPLDSVVELSRGMFPHIEASDRAKILQYMLSSYPAEIALMDGDAHKFIGETIKKYIPNLASEPEILSAWARYRHAEECFDIWLKDAKRRGADSYRDNAENSWVTPVSIAKKGLDIYNLDMLGSLGTYMATGFKSATSDEYYGLSRKTLEDFAQGLSNMSYSYPVATKYLLTETPLGDTLRNAVGELCKTTEFDARRKILPLLKQTVVTVGISEAFNGLESIGLPVEIPPKRPGLYRNTLIKESGENIGDQLGYLYKLGTSGQKRALQLSDAFTENFGRFISMEPVWVHKLLNGGIKREGLLSNEVLSFFTTPWEESVLEISKTGSTMRVHMSGEKAGSIDKIINTSGAEAWKIAAESLVTRGGDLLIGVEPYMGSEVSSGHSCVRTRVCGLEYGEILTILKSAEYDAQAKKFLQVAEIATDAVLSKLKELGLEHGHPHIKNFLFEFVRKDRISPKDITSPAVLNGEGLPLSSVELDPTGWAENPQDYYMVARLIDFDRAEKLSTVVNKELVLE